jgi:hypothetical protein
MQEAEVKDGVKEIVIPIQTEGTFVTVDNVTGAVGFETETKPVPNGLADVGVLAFELSNPSAGADTALIDWVDLTIWDGSRNPVQDPARFLRGLYVVTGSGARFQGDLGSNPVRVNLGPDLVLAADIPRIRGRERQCTRGQDLRGDTRYRSRFDHGQVVAGAHAGSRQENRAA